MKRPKRICLVSPGHLSTNPRLVKEAHALFGAGYDVQVVSGRYLPWGVDNDKLIADPQWANRTVPFGRQEVATGTHIRQKAVQNFASLVFKLGFHHTYLAETALTPVTRDLVRATCMLPRADLYIAHYLPALAAVSKAASMHNSKFAFDAEDFHFGELPELPQHQHAKALIRRIEQVYLPGAAYVTAASPMIAGAYAETYGIQLPTTILNVFPRKNAPDAPTPRGTAFPGPSLYWFSQTIGPGRGLETAIEALGRSRLGPHLYLRGTPAAGYQKVLQKLAASHNVAGQLHFLEPVVPDMLERAAANYDIGFVGELPDTKNRAIALTNKLFSYWTSGLPTLVSDIPAHMPLARKHHEFIRSFSDPASLVAMLDDWLSEPSQLASARKAAFLAAKDFYNWDREKHGLLKLVNQALSSRETGH